MRSNNLVSIVIPTKNSEQTLETCLTSLKNQSYQELEIIVVDNDSRDKTREIAQKYTPHVFTYGPERSAQRNLGTQKAKGKYFCFVDSDMILDKKIIKECVSKIDTNPQIAGIVIPEMSTGSSFWAKCKGFEDSFYFGVDWIEAPRFFKKEAFDKVSGYDDNLISGEDWDLSARIKKLGKIDRIESRITHDLQDISLKKIVEKKHYYAQNIKNYQRKQKQFSKQASPFSRISLFLRKPQKLIKHPCFSLGLFLMKGYEYIVYLDSRIS